MDATTNPLNNPADQSRGSIDVKHIVAPVQPEQVHYGLVDDHDHHDQHWLFQYVFSTDHKVIAKQFLITGIIWAFIGGAFSSIMRLQLGWPESTFPWLVPVLGKWIEAGQLNAEFYLALVTMHGTIMVFFVLTAGLSGTFSNFLIPLQVGARDMASGFMNMLSYWFFLRGQPGHAYPLFSPKLAQRRPARRFTRR